MSESFFTNSTCVRSLWLCIAMLCLVPQIATSDSSSVSTNQTTKFLLRFDFHVECVAVLEKNSFCVLQLNVAVIRFWRLCLWYTEIFIMKIMNEKSFAQSGNKTLVVYLSCCFFSCLSFSCFSFCLMRAFNFLISSSFDSMVDSKIGTFFSRLSSYRFSVVLLKIIKNQQKLTLVQPDQFVSHNCLCCYLLSHQFKHLFVFQFVQNF